MKTKREDGGGAKREGSGPVSEKNRLKKKSR